MESAPGMILSLHRLTLILNLLCLTSVKPAPQSQKQQSDEVRNEAKLLLNAHNFQRRSQFAGDMEYMVSQIRMGKPTD